MSKQEQPVKKDSRPANGTMLDPDMVRDLRKEVECLMPSQRRGGRSVWDVAADAFVLEGRSFGNRPR